jgi:transposase
MHYCGIDLASKSSNICVIDQQGKVLRERVIATEAAELNEALAGFDDLTVIIEASPLAETAARVVEDIGKNPVIIDARAAKNLMSSMKMTDRRDAKALAEIGRSGWYTEVHRKSAMARELRSILGARQTILKTSKMIRSSIQGLLRSHGVKVGQVSEGLFAERVLVLCEEYAPGLKAPLAAMLETWEIAVKKAKALKKAVDEMGRDDAVSQRLQSIPGIGPLISTAYQATIDDPHRFNRAEEVADYLGLAPRIYQSGEVERRGRITKEGDVLLRWHLVEGAHVLLTLGRDCALKRWGQSLEERKGPAKAKVAVARKLAILMWKLWKNEKTFIAFP